MTNTTTNATLEALCLTLWVILGRQLAVFLSKRMLVWMIKTSIILIPMNRPRWSGHHRQQQLLYLISRPCHEVDFPGVRPPTTSFVNDNSIACIIYAIAGNTTGTPISVHLCPLASRMCIHLAVVSCSSQDCLIVVNPQLPSHCHW